MRKRQHVPCCSVESHKKCKGAKTWLCLSDDDFTATPLLPPGPASYAELSNWPTDLLHRACDAHGLAVARMRELFRHGLDCNSDYSGYDCPRETLTQLFRAFTSADFFACQHSPSLRFTRSCDNADLPLRVLLHWAQVVDGGDSCVNSDIEGCLTDDAKDHLDKTIVDALNVSITVLDKKKTLG